MAIDDSGLVQCRYEMDPDDSRVGRGRVSRRREMLELGGELRG